MSLLWILLTLLPVLGGAERFNCKGRILGAYYADAKSGCKAFHVCVRVAGGGIRDFRFFCPPGTLFHQEAQTCTDWGDDDPLGCPADIYDGQFDLYKIGSGYDTKKLSSPGNREDEAEFGLQRAETGDRRLSQNNVAANRPESDLRAAHSSDFFSGQRDRGLDESASPTPPSPSSSPAFGNQAYQRQSFRRSTTQRTFPTPSSTQYPTPSQPSTFQPKPSNSPNIDVGSKRKLVRKRPIYVSTKAPPTTFSTLPPQSFNSESSQSNYNNRRVPLLNRQYQQQQQAQQLQPRLQQQQPQQQQQQPQQQQPQQQQPQQQQQHQPQQQPQQQPPQQPQQQPQQQSHQQQYFSTPNVPPQYKEYKDEYVEVSRVTPKQNLNRFFPNSPPSTPFAQSTAPPRFNKKDGLVELYNYDAQSTPGVNEQNDNYRPFKVRNNFSVQDIPREPDVPRVKNINFNTVREPTTTIDYTVPSKAFPTSTPAYKNNNFNSVSYEPEKNNFVPFSKQNYFTNNPTTTAATFTTIYTSSRPEPPLNLNTVAYNTNIGFHTQSENNFAESDEDDGQYRPPQGEDDGQYRPELYDHELLSGAHSLNIAASGNRLPEDRKANSKNQAKTQSSKPVASTAAPRPFRPAPSPTVRPTTRAPETTYPTTQQAQTQRTFDYIQTYTTTSRPTDYQALGQNYPQNNDASVRPSTTSAPRVAETRQPRPASRAQPPQSPSPTPAPQLTKKAPHLTKPSNHKEDNSYDYAYYDSDPGFSEYDHIEEFEKTKTRA